MRFATKGETTDWKRRSCALALATALAVAPWTAATAAEGGYKDEEGSNPARIVSYVLHPAGTVLEYTIFRPLHFIGSWLAPKQGYYGETHLNCRAERPPRECTDIVN